MFLLWKKKFCVVRHVYGEKICVYTFMQRQEETPCVIYQALAMLFILYFNILFYFRQSLTSLNLTKYVSLGNQEAYDSSLSQLGISTEFSDVLLLCGFSDWTQLLMSIQWYICWWSNLPIPKDLLNILNHISLLPDFQLPTPPHPHFKLVK